MVCLLFVILSCVCLVQCRMLPDNARVKRDAAPSIPEVNTTERLNELRNLMQKANISAYMVPSVDQHMSEYVAPHFRRRDYISGFTGSRGDAIVTMDKAALWTDGRYFLQAKMQLDDNWKLQKMGNPGIPTQAEWLKRELSSGDKVGLDTHLISISNFDDLTKKLSDDGILLASISPNLVDLIWKDRPALSNKTIFPLGLDFTGKQWQDKVKALRDAMKAKQATAVVLYKLDEVAWMLNLRGGDVPSNPFFFAFIIITADKVKVYVPESKVTDGVKTHLSVDDCSEMCAELLSYNTTKLMADIQAEAGKQSAKIWLDPYASYALKGGIADDKLLLEDLPVALWKSIKNPTEIEGMKRAYIKDSTAMVEFFYWLKNEVAKGPNEKLTEISTDKKLEEFKSQQKDYRGPSFDTIAGFGPNGAIIHYRATPATDTPVTDQSTFLVDSGSQFLDGTTDTTRTVHFGEPTDKMKDAYTRVLKGQIALALTVFPNTTQGRFLDPIARRALWENGLDYRHGTGHGIGMFLSVHEGPQRIASGCPRPWEKPIVPGMFQSDEPGYYEDGAFGIRLETVVVAVPAETQNHFNDVQYVTFESVSFVPYWKKLIDLDIMTKTELKWLNDYHKKCREKIGAMLKEQNKGEVYDWLAEITEPIEVGDEPSPRAGVTSLTMSGVTLLLATVIMLFLV